MKAKNFHSKSLNCLAITLLFASIGMTVKSAIERRALLDIGSSGTKLEVADIDTITQKVKDVVLSTSRLVGYRSDLARQKNPYCFSAGTIEQGIRAINELKGLAEELSPAPSAYSALATAGFRAAPCSDKLIEQFNEETGIRISTISQDEEARLAFNGLVARTGFSRKDAISWETGGGSMQMVTENPDSSLAIHGTLGNVPFRNLIITYQHKIPQTTFSPNPLSKEDVERALSLAIILAQNVPQELKDKIKKPSSKILATGGIIVTVRSATHSPKRNTFTLKELEHVLKNVMTGLTDQDIAKDNPEVDPSFSVSGLALIVGFMKALDMKTITLVSGGLSDGALVDPRYFSPSKLVSPEDILD